jgi:hypothetical protein
MSNVKTRVIPVLIGETGSILKSFRKYRSEVRGKQQIKDLQKQPHWAVHTYFG